MAKNKMSKKLKALFISATCIFAAAFILGTFLLIWFSADSYKDFENFYTRFEIPGLDDGVVPQGLANSDGTFFTSNYMIDGSASRVYVIDDSGQEKYVTFEYDGETYTGHCGGIATDGNHFWMCSDNYIYTVSYSSVTRTASADGGVVELTSRMEIELNAAFLYYGGNFLIVGEFYRSKNYQTDESHHLTTPCGDKNHALAFLYAADDSDDGIEDTPTFAVSIPDRIQGFATTDGKLCLSQSYGLSNSHILVYDYGYNMTSSRWDYITIEDDGSIALSDSGITLFYLDSECLINDYSVPCMSEGLCTYDGEVYVLFESAGEKYRRYVRERLYNVYSFTPVAAE